MDNKNIWKLIIRIRQLESYAAFIYSECQAINLILEREKSNLGIKKVKVIHRKPETITQQEIDDEMKRVWEGTKPKGKKPPKNNLKAT